MTAKERYESAKALYASIGVDTDKAIETLKSVPVAMHCWQGDDVKGFDQDGPLTGGIQTTGNYPGKARTPDELMADMEKVLSLVPGQKKLNLHASYAIFEPGEYADRDKLEPKHFAKWVEFAKNTIWALILTPPSSPMKWSAMVLPSQARTRKCAVSGSTTARHVSVFPSILLRKPVFPA